MREAAVYLVQLRGMADAGTSECRTPARRERTRRALDPVTLGLALVPRPKGRLDEAGAVA